MKGRVDVLRTPLRWGRKSEFRIFSQLWDRETFIWGTRISADGTIVSYDIDINGNHSTRHRKFIQKLNLPNVRCDDAAVAVEISNDDSGDISGGGDSEGAGRPGQCGDKGVILREPERAGQGPPRRLPRLQCRAGPGR